MKLIVISPPGEDERELPALSGMLASRLERYHLRKPSWSVDQLEVFLSRLSAAQRLCIVIHGNVGLVEKWDLGGHHWKDDGAAPDRPRSSTRFVSRACHDLRQLSAAMGYYDAVLLSPVFSPLSKMSERPVLDSRQIPSLLSKRTDFQRRTEVLALGGIQESTTQACRELGFDGVAAHGAIWQSTDPLAAFAAMQKCCEQSLTDPLGMRLPATAF